MGTENTPTGGSPVERVVSTAQPETEMNEQPKCTICGEPLNPGQEMFRFHGSDGLDCPKPPLPKPPTDTERMNWLALHPRGAQIIVDGVTKDCLFYGISLAPGVDLRSAIDTMMRASANA